MQSINIHPSSQVSESSAWSTISSMKNSHLNAPSSEQYLEVVEESDSDGVTKNVSSNPFEPNEKCDTKRCQL